jgi:ABC-type Fe3+/spermidine/putrescine transport system ATPase subunit
MVGDFVGSINLLSGWTTGGDKQLVRDGQTLSHESAAGSPGVPVNIAFRPEDARLFAASQPRAANHLVNCFVATIQRVEFRGAFRRVYLSSGSDAAGIVVDAPLDGGSDSFIRAGGEVAVHVPADHVRVFRQDGSAV